jgi:hypothetical protein
MGSRSPRHVGPPAWRPKIAWRAGNRSLPVNVRADLDTDRVLHAFVSWASRGVHLEHAIHDLLLVGGKGHAVADADFSDPDRSLHLFDVALGLGLERARLNLDSAR